MFDDLDLTIGWLKSPVAAFGDVTPLSLIDTDVGAG
ncbi:MbcA/ParS/Xre antitoxin family protein [Caballeronia telluris]|nr:MbcA/ParS/Xre antitoxin family protein [Caballeronia telluris]